MKSTETGVGSKAEAKGAAGLGVASWKVSACPSHLVPFQIRKYSIRAFLFIFLRTPDLSTLNENSN
jgi:hypothetical protein